LLLKVGKRDVAAWFVGLKKVAGKKRALRDMYFKSEHSSMSVSEHCNLHLCWLWCRRNAIQDMLEIAGVSKSNPYYIVEQGKVSATYC